MMELSNINNFNMPIVFISDLHFDYTFGEYNLENALKNQQEFIKLLKSNYSTSLICLAGDFYDDYKMTLNFINELENNKILGFFVLGNHDFLTPCPPENIISAFNNNDKHNKYFKFLTTGKKYYFNDICVIGDTGWSYKIEDKSVIDLKWIEFANKVLDEEEKVLIITHYPQPPELKNTSNCWKIFGHEHKKFLYHQNNSVSCQRGDRRTINEKLVFGELIRASDNTNISISNFPCFYRYYLPQVITDSKDVLKINEIEKHGFYRCSMNKKNLFALATSPKEYIEEVKRKFNNYMKNNYIGYIWKNPSSNSILNSIQTSIDINAIQTSIDILECGNISDVISFMTAAIITGYVYNDTMSFLWSMRPLDKYDIIHFYMLFLTIQKYNISIDKINSIQKNNKLCIKYSNVNLYFPKVNGYSLQLSDIKNLLNNESLLSTAKLIENSQSKNIYTSELCNKIYIAFIDYCKIHKDHFALKGQFFEKDIHYGRISYKNVLLVRDKMKFIMNELGYSNINNILRFWRESGYLVCGEHKFSANRRLNTYEKAQSCYVIKHNSDLFN